MRRDLREGGPAFTLVETLVVVAIIAVLVAIMAPTLFGAREKARAAVCLSNLRQLAQAVTIYDQADVSLPGPVHPAIYRNQTAEAYRARGYGQDEAGYLLGRQLSTLLRPILRDELNVQESMVDVLATCPTVSMLYTESDVERWVRTYDLKDVFPVHYTLNNWGPGLHEPQLAVREVRIWRTDPSHYFGFSPRYQPQAGDDVLAAAHRPRRLEEIAEPSRDWMTADAWTRGGCRKVSEHGGTYQSEWTGAVLPDFAPHGVAGGSYAFGGFASRACGPTQTGQTQTAFFDGHAERVANRPVYDALDPDDPDGFYHGYPHPVNVANFDRERFYW